MNGLQAVSGEVMGHSQKKSMSTERRSFADVEQGIDTEEGSGDLFARAISDEFDDEAVFLAAIADVEALSEAELRSAKGLPEPLPDAQETQASSSSRAAGQPPHANANHKKNHRVEELGPLGVMNFVRSSLSRKVERQLRRGAISLADDLDLHGMTWKEAKREVAQFLRNAPEHGEFTCVLIVHGKGHGAVLGAATLKSQLYKYLQQQPYVTAAISALPKDGGLGAVYVLLG